MVTPRELQISQKDVFAQIDIETVTCPATNREKFKLNTNQLQQEGLQQERLEQEAWAL